MASQKLIDIAQFFLAQVPENFFSLLGISVVFLGFWAMGRVLTGRNSSEAALLGWASIYCISLCVGFSGVVSLRYVAVLFLVLVVACIVVGGIRVPIIRQALPALVVSLPLIGLALVMPLLHWDTFSHWVLNGVYLYRFDAFPAAPLGGFPSIHATYPPGTSLLYYLASLVVNRFTETAGIFINVSLTLVAMGYVAELIRESVFFRIDGESVAARYGIALAAFFIVVALNPCFQAGNYFSGIADPAVGVIVLAIVMRWCSSMVPIGQAPQDAPRFSLFGTSSLCDPAVLFLLGVLLSGVKHSGWTLALILSAAGALTSVVHNVPWRRWSVAALALFAGSMLAHVVWTFYLSSHLPVGDQFSIRPFSEWRFDLLTHLLNGALADVRSYLYYYVLILMTTIAGSITLLRHALLRRSQRAVPAAGNSYAVAVSNSARLSMALGFVALAMPAHLLSLFAAYLGTGFTEREIIRAASLHRYSTHVGFSMSVFGLTAILAIMLPLLRNRFSRMTPRRWLIGITAAYVLLLAGKVALPSLQYGLYYMDNEALRDSAARAAKILPSTDTFAVLGSEWGVNFANYESWRPRDATHGPMMHAWHRMKTADDVEGGRDAFKRWSTDPLIDHIWILDFPLLASELTDLKGRSLVWSRSTGRWRVIE